MKNIVNETIEMLIYFIKLGPKRQFLITWFPFMYLWGFWSHRDLQFQNGS